MLYSSIFCTSLQFPNSTALQAEFLSSTIQHVDVLVASQGVFPQQGHLTRRDAQLWLFASLRCSQFRSLVVSHVLPGVLRPAAAVGCGASEPRLPGAGPWRCFAPRRPGAGAALRGPQRCGGQRETKPYQGGANGKQQKQNGESKLGSQLATQELPN